MRDLKAERRARVAQREQAERTICRVLARDVLWAEDGAFVGTSPRGRETMEVLRDAGPTRTVGIGTGPAATGEDLVTLLEATRCDRGTLPLVLSRDNGGAQKSEALREYCEREKVVVLRNHPRTPQHNAFAERAIGELKEVSGLDADVVVASPGEVRRRLEEAWHRLDHGRLRAGHSYRTAAAVDEAMPRWYHRVSRERFYATARAAIEEATRPCRTARARRLLEREAIFRTLEDFGLILRTRGGRPVPRKETATIA
jgi:transposase InsO family protein